MFKTSFLIASLVLILSFATAQAAPSDPSALVDRIASNQAKREVIVRRGTHTDSALKRRASITPGQSPYAVFIDSNIGSVSWIIQTDVFRLTIYRIMPPILLR
jgi:hypothetical protein